MKESIEETDILIIGGGIAGLNAAIAARDKGSDVLVVEKACIERSGSVGGGVDHYMLILDEGEPWDTCDSYVKNAARLSVGAVDIDLVRDIFCKEIKSTIDVFKRIGVPLEHPITRKIERYKYTVNFKGKDLKPKLAKEVRRLGAKVYDKVMCTKLLTNADKVAGAIGFNVRDGSFHVFRAKAVVVATGDIVRLYRTPTGLEFNTWQCPYDTGDGQLMAFKAGAELANMEYARVTIVPKGFSSPGFNAWMIAGGKYVNALGEPYMKKYWPEGRPPRDVCVLAALTEIKEGRGPLYLDCRHLSKQDIELLKATLSWDKDTLGDFLEQKGIDLSEELLEIEVNEGCIAAPTERCGSGIMIDTSCSSTTVKGLYAAGDCANFHRLVSGAFVSGIRAGQESAAYAQASELQPIDNTEISSEKKRIYRPLSLHDGITHKEFEDILRRIMTENVGVTRTDKSLRTGLSKLERLQECCEQMVATNYHELMRVMEAQNLLECGRLAATAALARKESRFPPYHYRADYPNTDNENWLKLVVLKHEDSGAKVSYRDLSYPRQWLQDRVE